MAPTKAQAPKGKASGSAKSKSKTPKKSPTKVLKPKEEDGAAQAQHRRNLTPNKKPAKNLIFGGCKFYFDVKSAASITKPYYEVIQSCGGTVEEFFSRDITHVITDAPEWKLKNAGGPSTIASPGTPHSLSTVTNSPWSPSVAVTSNEEKKAKSRIDLLVERARQQKQGSSNVLDNAVKWGQKVWLLKKFISWVEKHNLQKKQQRPHLTRSRSVSSGQNHNQRDLLIPFIKYESVEQDFSPVYQEGMKFPSFHIDGAPGQSPFAPPKPNREVSREPQTGQKLFYWERSLSHLRYNNELVFLHEEKKGSRQRDTETDRKKENRFMLPGYCEICEMDFNKLGDHIMDTVHFRNCSKKLSHQLNQSIELAKSSLDLLN